MLGAGPSLARQRQQPPLMDPQEEQGIVSSLAEKTLGGVSMVGNLLGLPASMFADVLMGENPLDQLLSPFSDIQPGGQQRNYLSDVLENYGVLPKNKETGFTLFSDPGEFMLDFARLGADIVGDPLFFTGASLGKAALTQGGQALRKANLLDDVMKVAPTGMGPRQARMNTKVSDVLVHASDDQIDNFAKAAKDMNVDVDDLLNQPVGGGIGFNVGNPFGAPKWTTQGAASERLAKGMDRVGDYVRWSAPGRFAHMLFNPAVAGKWAKMEQQIAGNLHRRVPAAIRQAERSRFEAFDEMNAVHREFDAVYGDQLKSGGNNIPQGAEFGFGDIVMADDRGNYGRVVGMDPDGNFQVFFRNPETGATAQRPMHPSYLHAAFPAGTTEAQAYAMEQSYAVFDKVIRHTAERPGYQGEWHGLMPEFAGTPAPSADLLDKIASASHHMKEANDTLYAEISAKGARTSWIEDGDEFAHFPRYVDPSVREKSEFFKTMLTRTGSMNARTTQTRELPVDIANKLLKDSDARGPWATNRIFNKYNDWLDDDYPFEIPTDSGLVLQGKQAHAKDIADWVSRHRPGRDLYTRQTLEDFYRYQKNTQVASKNLDAIHETLKDHLGQGEIPLVDAFRAADMHETRALEHLAGLTGKSVDELSAMNVPEDVVKAIAGSTRMHRDRVWATKIGQAIDGFLNTFRASVTLPFPSFWARNHVSGQHVNMAMGDMATPADLASYCREYKRAMDMAKHPEQYEKEIREISILGFAGNRIGFEDVELFRTGGQGVLPAGAHRVKQTYREARQFVGDNPSWVDAIPGAKSVRRGFRTVAGTGGKVSQLVEWQNRVPMYLYLRKKGWSAEAASQLVKDLHFDYGDLAPFEKIAARRIFPFYTFSRKIAPLVLKSLVEKPGGALAQTLRATSFGRDIQDIVPEYVGTQAAVPLPSGPSGDARYLTGFGFAHEDPMSFVRGDLKQSGLELLSRTNPMIKGPLEYLTGQSFFQTGPSGGRPIEDLDPTLGRTMANIRDFLAGTEPTTRTNPVRFPGDQIVEALLSNTPPTRAMTTLRTLTDRRKGAGAKAMNLLTGFRVTDVSPGASDAQLQELIAQAQKGLGAKTFSKTWIPDDIEQGFSGQEAQLAAQLDALERLLIARKKERRKQSLKNP